MIIQLKVSDSIPGRLKTKAKDVTPDLVKRVNRMLTTIEGVVKFVAPRGKHCSNRGVAGNLKGNIKHRITPNGGEVYVDEQGAPYVKYVLKGRGPVKSKDKVLHFCIAGKHIFVRSVKASKPNDFLKKAHGQSITKLQPQIEALGRWLETI